MRPPNSAMIGLRSASKASAGAAPKYAADDAPKCRRHEKRRDDGRQNIKSDWNLLRRFKYFMTLTPIGNLATKCTATQKHPAGLTGRDPCRPNFERGVHRLK